ncbi:UNVERIFIED_CONTAM: hypothetical protein HHA_452220 [Hammondia hammondi]|eukprot:XP_008885258.1 hypothetical protein HHA_452220 [Hammondia hammondi]
MATDVQSPSANTPTSGSQKANRKKKETRDVPRGTTHRRGQSPRRKKPQGVCKFRRTDDTKRQEDKSKGT